MRKILLIIDNLGSGGAQNQMTMLAVLLKNHGYNVEVFFYYPQSFFEYRLESAGVKTHKMDKSSRYSFDVIWNLTKLRYKNKSMITISYLTTPNFYNVFTKLLTLGKSKAIISYRSSTSIPQLSKLSKIKYWFINTFADHLVFNSKHERDNWTKFYPKLLIKSTCIYNYVDLKRFKLRKNFVRKRKLLVVGSVSPDKNGIIVIEALNQLRNKFDIDLTWFGQKIFTITKRREYILEMECKIKEYNLEDVWTWLEPTEDIEHIYPKYDALILASKKEGLPNVVCESLSTGTPVLISNVLDHPLLVKDEYNGFLFDPDHAPCLVSAVEKLYCMNDLEYKEMCRNAREHATNLFGEQFFLNNYLDLIDK